MASREGLSVYVSGAVAWAVQRAAEQRELDKTSSEINRHKVNVTTSEKLVKRLTKGIEESKKDREKLSAETEKMMSMFKEIEKKVFVVQEEYKKTQEMIDNHKVELDKTKEEYTKLKKAMDELRATEVDAEYKLQDTKKLAKEWEMKVKTFKKRLDEIHIMLLNTWIICIILFFQNPKGCC
ncbi:structural maintenance of chromosomes protein 4 [Zea mays]|uniref:structural maintenance of chromosomes protein 4 n=1 Tax=Zea mays TaxID=4577 RepID=UPI000C6C5F38|nr:structural maintenance of chromosomes protein 4 [Zea mays]|eukprot:XP_023156191.1 structural maintenance of chromosomes protein 4 [Zea mays]